MNEIDEKRELAIYRRLLIRLHTARWTHHDDIVIEILDAIGAYSYARTNSNAGGYELEEKQRIETLLRLEEI